MKSPRHCLLLTTLALTLAASAQSPRITKVDPPNWWASMPPAMLLVRGENLTGAHFNVGKLRLDHTAISDNGHWAQLWLADAPKKAVIVTLTAETPAGHASLPFRFEPRRPATEGFAGFSGADVMYLVMPDRFADGNLSNDGPDARSHATSPEALAERAKPRGWHGGDLPGITAHLDYLQSLGVTALWPTPIYQNHSPVAYHGYHATDYYAVDEHFGTLNDLKTLANALHAHHMKLVLDTVPNHVGPFHPWVTDSPTPDWFHGTAANHPASEYRFAALVDPHAPERDRDGTLHGWFADNPALPDNNTDSPAVAKYLQQNVIWWIEETGADALRYDTFPYVNREFWHDLNTTLRSLYPHLTEVGEVSDGDPEITSAFAGDSTRAGVDTALWTPFDFPFKYALRNVFATGAPMSDLALTLAKDALYAHPERLVPFLDNHDQVRFLSEPGATVTGLRLAIATLLTTRGTPQLYVGDELALTGGEDPDNRRDLPGGFPAAPGLPQPPSVFDPATRTPEQQAIFTWTQQLLALRTSQPAFQTGAEEVLLADRDTFVFTRNQGSRHILVAIHRGAPAQLTVGTHRTTLESAAPGQVLFGTGTAARGTNGRLELNLPADSVLITAF